MTKEKKAGFFVMVCDFLKAFIKRLDFKFLVG